MQVCTIGINHAGAFGPGDDLIYPLSRGQRLRGHFMPRTFPRSLFILCSITVNCFGCIPLSHGFRNQGLKLASFRRVFASSVLWSAFRGFTGPVPAR
ncbi:hypothetical protein [Thalassospira sp.]|uniref:hypothetical protein n=1 Tax=Thalassospira sp. TaxID=1912094 RepID=UPI003AA9498B